MADAGSRWAAGYTITGSEDLELTESDPEAVLDAVAQEWRLRTAAALDAALGAGAVDVTGWTRNDRSVGYFIEVRETVPTNGMVDSLPQGWIEVSGHTFNFYLDTITETAAAVATEDPSEEEADAVDPSTCFDCPSEEPTGPIVPPPGDGGTGPGGGGTADPSDGVEPSPTEEVAEVVRYLTAKVREWAGAGAEALEDAVDWISETFNVDRRTAWWLLIVLAILLVLALRRA